MQAREPRRRRRIGGLARRTNARSPRAASRRRPEIGQAGRRGSGARGAGRGASSRSRRASSAFAGPPVGRLGGQLPPAPRLEPPAHLLRGPRQLDRVVEPIRGEDLGHVPVERPFQLGLEAPKLLGPLDLPGPDAVTPPGYPGPQVSGSSSITRSSSRASSPIARRRASQIPAASNWVGVRRRPSRCSERGAPRPHPRPLGPVESSRQTAGSSGWRRRQASSHRRASEKRPVRVAMLARPSQTRSSSGARRMAASKLGCAAPV